MGELSETKNAMMEPKTGKLTAIASADLRAQYRCLAIINIAFVVCRVTGRRQGKYVRKYRGDLVVIESLSENNFLYNTAVREFAGSVLRKSDGTEVIYDNKFHIGLDGTETWVNGQSWDGFIREGIGSVVVMMAMMRHGVFVHQNFVEVKTVKIYLAIGGIIQNPLKWRLFARVIVVMEYLTPEKHAMMVTPLIPMTVRIIAAPHQTLNVICRTSRFPMGDDMSIFQEVLMESMQTVIRGIIPM